MTAVELKAMLRRHHAPVRGIAQWCYMEEVRRNVYRSVEVVRLNTEAGSEDPAVNPTVGEEEALLDLLSTVNLRVLTTGELAEATEARSILSRLSPDARRRAVDILIQRGFKALQEYGVRRIR